MKLAFCVIGIFGLFILAPCIYEAHQEIKDRK